MKLLTILVFGALMIPATYAQDKLFTLFGKIGDGQGKAHSDHSAWLTSAERMTRSDEEGGFTMGSLPEQYEIVFSSLNYSSEMRRIDISDAS